jgi:hypothetical protein
MRKGVNSNLKRRKGDVGILPPFLPIYTPILPNSFHQNHQQQKIRHADPAQFIFLLSFPPSRPHSPPQVVATMAKDRRKNTSVMEKLRRAQVLPKCNNACPPLGGPNFIVGGGGGEGGVAAGGGEGEEEEGGDDELSPRRTLRVLLPLLRLLVGLLVLAPGRREEEAAPRVGAKTARLLPAAAASLKMSPQLVVAPLLILSTIVPVSSGGFS